MSEHIQCGKDCYERRVSIKKVKVVFKAFSAYVNQPPLDEKLHQQTLALGFQELTGQKSKHSLQAKTRSGCRGLKSL